jgi:2'-5' RNA ligase
MGTAWRGLLSPVDKPTGDGRRMAKDAISFRELPLPFSWQRSDEVGHDTSVIIGSLLEATVCSVADAIAGEWISAEAVAALNLAPTDMGAWGKGEMFDDQPDLPRLAEDVAEALLLLAKKVIGPSVDPGAASAVLVRTGTDVPLTGDELDLLFLEAMDSGVDPDIEELYTRYEVAAATLVKIPAFAEARPIELLGAPVPALTAAVNTDGWAQIDLAPQDTAWDEAAATARMAQACGIGADSPDWACYAAGFLYTDDSADAGSVGAYSWPICDVVDGNLMIVAEAVMGCATMMEAMYPADQPTPAPPGNAPPGQQPTHAMTDMPAADVEAMRGVLGDLYTRMAAEFNDPTIVAPWAQAAATVVASLTASARAIPAAVFANPGLTRPTFITVTNNGDGLLRIAGHVAPFGVCHPQFRDTCRTAPASAADYIPFHRYVADTDTGLLGVGRLTTGFGRVGTGCSCCPGKADHACDEMGLNAAIAHYDRLTTLADVRAGEDDFGIWVAGVVRPGLATEAMNLLRGQRFSGDWRDYAGHLELIEVLGLTERDEPAFPIPTVTLRQGRQVSLTASMRPAPTRAPAVLSQADFAASIADLVVARMRAEAATALTAAAEVHTGAMVALRMTDEQATAMAVDGGEAPGQLHMTLAHLGEAADIPPEVQQAIVDALTAYAATLTQPVEGTVFSVNVYNPAADERDTAIVAGVNGEQLPTIHAAVNEALAGAFANLPEQYAPWAAHIALIYTDNLALVGQLVDRTDQPVTFDRLRIAFAGENTDLALPGGTATQPEPDPNEPVEPTEPATVASLAAQVAAALALVTDADRYATATQLLRELETVNV